MQWGGNMKAGLKLTAATMLLACLPSDARHAFAWQVDTSPTETAVVEAVRSGASLEKDRNWLEAIEHYEDSLKTWKSNEDLKYGLRRSKIHFGIDRRYSDRSFKRALVVKSRNEALTLFDDVFTKIRDNYVQSVSSTAFIAHGTESLYMALANERFVQYTVPSATKQQLSNFRKLLLKNYWNRRVSESFMARETISEVCNAANRELGLSAGPIVMEYLFGGCNSLDDYSNFLTADRLSDLYGNIDGEFVGLGIEMKGEKGEGLHLVNVLPGSPAERGGMRRGDYIISINGRDCREMSTDDAAHLLRGPSGSTVALGLRNAGRTRQGEFTRRAVQVKSIPLATMVDKSYGIGYLRMTGFQKTTTEELDQALAKLEGQGMRALIWDLRNNPGGLLDTAASVLDRFIDNGIVVSTEGRVRDQNQSFTAQSFHTRDMPIVLLVDDGSASASEIVAGAVRDYRRGTIVGTKTYGKWSVQSIFPIRESTGLRLTTAKFYSPHHHNYAKIGVEPDVKVEEYSVAFRGEKPPKSLPYRASELAGDAYVEKGLEILRSKGLVRK
ncbi:S41 family peptidase [bacterium]|nr:S41 family peptidase [bacterium]